MRSLKKLWIYYAIGHKQGKDLRYLEKILGSVFTETVMNMYFCDQVRENLGSCGCTCGKHERFGLYVFKGDVCD